MSTEEHVLDFTVTGDTIQGARGEGGVREVTNDCIDGLRFGSAVGWGK